MHVQNYIIENYSKKLLELLYEECSSNEWDYLVSIDNPIELEDFIKPYLCLFNID
jgi:hypothetical protein